MLRVLPMLRKARIHTFSPWKRRPSGLVHNSNPEFVHPGHFRNRHKRLNPEDPTGLIKPSHVLLKHCPLCNRTKMVPLRDREVFHTCCEGKVVMKVKASMKNVMDRANRLQVMHRQWDVDGNRPWSAATRPRPKGRSKFAKK